MDHRVKPGGDEGVGFLGSLILPPSGLAGGPSKQRGSLFRPKAPPDTGSSDQARAREGGYRMKAIRFEG